MYALNCGRWLLRLAYESMHLLALTRKISTLTVVSWGHSMYVCVRVGVGWVECFLFFLSSTSFVINTHGAEA